MKLPEEAKKSEIFSEISKMDEKDEHSPSEFYYPDDLETLHVETETGITECHIPNNLLIELASLGLYCHDLGPIESLSKHDGDGSENVI